jgi:hypothetical protein
MTNVKDRLVRRGVGCCVRTGASPVLAVRGTKCAAPAVATSVRQPRRCPSELHSKTARMGKGKAAGFLHSRRLCCLWAAPKVSTWGPFFMRRSYTKVTDNGVGRGIRFNSLTCRRCQSEGEARPPVYAWLAALLFVATPPSMTDIIAFAALAALAVYATARVLKSPIRRARRK